MGPYEYVHKVYKPLKMDTGDFTIAVDKNTGKGYLIFDRPHFQLVTATLSENFTEVTGEYSVHYDGLHPPYTREAPLILKKMEIIIFTQVELLVIIQTQVRCAGSQTGMGNMRN